MSANRISLEVEVDVHVFTEAARVIVSVRLGVTERFEDTVRLKQNVLYSVQHGSIRLITDEWHSYALRDTYKLSGLLGWRGGLVVGLRTCDLRVAGSRPGRDAAAQQP